MIILHERDGHLAVTSIAETPRAAEIAHHAAVVVHHAAEVVHHPAVTDIAAGINTEAWVEIVAEAWDEVTTEAWDETVTPAETEAEFTARMIAAHVAPSARHIVVEASTLPEPPPERWIVDWDAGTVTLGPVPVAVPASVTNYQARAALLRAGLFAQVNAAVQAMGPGTEAYQAWEYANNVYRDSPLIVQLGAALGLTGAQIDALFVAAAAIDA